MAYKDDDRVLVHNHQTGMTYKTAWRAINSPAKRKRMGIELVEDDDTVSRSEHTVKRVEELKKDFAKDKPKAESQQTKPEPEDTTSEVAADTEPALDSHTVKELKAIADDRGIEYAKNAGKAKMIELLTQ